MSTEKIVSRPEVLSDDFVPDKLHARDEYLTQLKTCLAPALKGRKPLHALLVGPSGSGKTAVAKTMLKNASASQIPNAYVNCWDTPSFYAILDNIVAQLGILRAEKIDTGFKIKVIEEHLRKKPSILVLDEIDKLPPKEANSALYNLSSMGNTGLICIAQDKHFFHSLEERVQARLYPTLIIFGSYSDAQVSEIVRHRSSHALADAAIDEAQLRFIASQCGGNARIGLEILRKAASFAEQDRAGKITRNHLKLASIASNGSKRDYLLSQNEHLRLLYDIIKENPGIVSGELWNAYNARCLREKKQPVANRTFSLYARKLCFLHLIVAERAGTRGNVRKFRIAD